MQRATWIPAGILVLVMGPGSSALATPSWKDFQRETLIGLHGVLVMADQELATKRSLTDIPIGGVDHTVLQKAVETRLGQAGIHVYGETDRPPSLESAILWPRITLEDLGKGVLAYSVELHLWQLVSLKREPAGRLLAATWSSQTRIGLVGGIHLYNLLDVVGSAVDEFIAEYRAANPGK